MLLGFVAEERRHAFLTCAVTLVMSAGMIAPSVVARAATTPAVSHGPGNGAAGSAQAQVLARSLGAAGRSGRGPVGSAPDIVAGPVIDDLGQAVAVSGGTAVVGAPGVNNNAGAAYVFVRNGTRWGLQAVLTDPRNVPNDFFAGSVSLAGDTALIGATGVAAGTGAAYVYVRAGTHWALRAVLAGPGKAKGRFGISVALAGTTAVIGALGISKSTGAAYIYTRTGTTWRLHASLADPLGVNGDLFGDSVAVTSGSVVIGAENANGASGAAYVYTLSGAHWRLAATLTDPRHHRGDCFGSVAVSGSTVLVGADGTNNSAGAAYVYVRSGSRWPLRATLTGPGSLVGLAVALSKSTALVGAPVAGQQGGGAAYLYHGSGSRWHRVWTFADPNRSGSFDDFGFSVAMAGPIVLVGADAANNLAGAGYLYAQSGSRWGRQAALTDPRGDAGNSLGAAVAISGTIAVVGAWGVNVQSGAVYIYVRAGGRWRRQATLRDPGLCCDYFGSAVAISGSTVIVGAWAHDVGANFFAGVVYVYVRSGRQWRHQATIRDPRPGSFHNFGSAVAISGSTMIIGSGGSNFTSSRPAFVYVRSGSRWHLQARLPNPGGSKLNNFGDAVAIAGGTALIGANGAKDFAGAAYVYVQSGSHWRLQASLPDPNGRPNDGFGTSLALSGAQAVIGAPGVRYYAGAAYLYARNGSRWRRQAALAVPRRVSVSGGFGGAAALTGTGRGTTALISGLSVSGLATAKRQCGSAFEFTRATGRWRERARVADPRCTSYDEFGYALSISGGTALIGAPGTDHNTGAVYLLSLL